MTTYMGSLRPLLGEMSTASGGSKPPAKCMYAPARQVSQAVRTHAPRAAQKRTHDPDVVQVSGAGPDGDSLGGEAAVGEGHERQAARLEHALHLLITSSGLVR